MPAFKPTTWMYQRLRMPVGTTGEFVTLLEKSGLLTADQFERSRELAEGCGTPRRLAKHLVQQGWLTRWQSQQLLAGRHSFFLGKYKLLSNVGKGGMGTVFKAEHPRLNRVVALKVMSQELLKNSDAVARFVREIQSAAALNHPHIVAAYDADCVGETYFLVMEYVDGDDLKAWIAEHERLPVPWACECIRQAALGLQHAHESGLVHRDIKPSNLLVVENDGAELPHVKILDMGLARFVSDTQESGGLTRTGQVMGTPDYIAPEQAEDTRGADIRADIFSLGCTLFHAVTGQVPFPGGNMMEKLLARVRQDAPPLSSLHPDLPTGLDAVVAKMLARNPDDRYQTPAELAEALVPFALGTMPQATEPTVMLQPDKGQNDPPAKVESKPDTTLNRFLNDLGDRPAETARVRRPSQSWRDHLSNRSVQMWSGGIAGCLLLVMLTAVFLGDNNGGEPNGGPPGNAQDQQASGDREPTDKEDSRKAGTTSSPKTAATPNYALSFDGKDDRVVVAGLDNLHEGPLTMEAIIRAAPKKREGYLLRVNGPRFRTVSVNDGVFWAVENDVDLRMMSRKGPTERWVHVAAVFGSEVRLFIDGQPARRRIVRKGQGNAAQFQQGDSFMLGGQRDPDYGFQGLMREFRVSGSERYQEAFTPPDTLTPDTDTLALYDFDEAEGDVLKDSSGNGHHGQIHGATWVKEVKPGEYRAVAENGQGVDLLKFVNPDQHAVEGKWKLVNGVLSSPATFGPGAFHPKLEIPFDAPLEYDLEVEVERKTGMAGLVIGLVMGRSRGTVSLAYRHRTTGKPETFLAKIDGDTNTTPLRGSLFSNNVRSRITCAVRERRIKVTVDDREVAAWSGDINRFAVHPTWQVQSKRNLFLGTQGTAGGSQFHIHRIRLRPLGKSANYALSFDGVDDYVEIPGLHFNGEKPFTVEAWLHPQAARGKRVSFYSIGPGGGAYLMNYPRGSGGVNYYGGILANRSGGLADGAPAGLAHVAFVSSPTGLSLFANGRKLDASLKLVAKQIRGPIRALIGASPGGEPGEPDGPPHRWFRGRIDELRVSTVARYTEDFTPAEHFEPDEHTLALYHFDEGQGAVLKDSSGNGHHGAIHGATWVKPNGPEE